MSKAFYYHTKPVYGGSPLTNGRKSYTAPEMFSMAMLDNQQGLFKVTMKANANVALAPPFHVNPVIKLWHNLSQSQHLGSLISEYFKAVEIGCYMVLGFVEDERCFSTLKFLKSCQQNYLGKHLPLVVRMFRQTITLWRISPTRRPLTHRRTLLKLGAMGMCNL